MTDWEKPSEENIESTGTGYDVLCEATRLALHESWRPDVEQYVEWERDYRERHKDGRRVICISPPNPEAPNDGDGNGWLTFPGFYDYETHQIASPWPLGTNHDVTPLAEAREEQGGLWLLDES